jgi:two-component system nitrate/nitrite response regulator NarL
MRVLVCDDHALFREGLRLLLQRLDDSIDVALTGSCETGVQEAAHVPFDLVLMDWHMDGLAGAPALLAFIPKDASPEVLMLALRTIASGGVYLPGSVLAGSSQADSDEGLWREQPAVAPRDVRQAFPNLTERQADVLRSALRGLPNKLIARELGISDGTVKTHLSAVFRELDVQSRTEALYVAAKHGVKIS